jgi:hypothetical protein
MKSRESLCIRSRLRGKFAAERRLLDSFGKGGPDHPGSGGRGDDRDRTLSFGDKADR